MYFLIINTSNFSSFELRSCCPVWIQSLINLKRSFYFGQTLGFFNEKANCKTGRGSVDCWQFWWDFLVWSGPRWVHSDVLNGFPGACSSWIPATEEPCLRPGVWDWPPESCTTDTLPRPSRAIKRNTQAQRWISICLFHTDNCPVNQNALYSQSHIY